MNRNWMNAVCMMLAVALSGAAAAQTYPSKSVRLITPYPPGSAMDTVARVLAQEMSKDWGQPVLTDSRPGASSIIAADACAKSPADGYTICLVSRATLSFVPAFYKSKKLPFDPAKDFEPIANLFDLVSVFTVHPSVQAGTVTDLIALARAKPGSLNFGSVGDGTPPHLVVEWIKKNRNVNMVHVPYKGAAPLAQAMMTGEIQLSYVSAGTVLGAIRAGKLKAIAVSGEKRSPLFPGVPTLGEAGLAGVDGRIWFGLVAPAGTPGAIVGAIYSGLTRLFANETFREQRIVSQGLEPALVPPAEFGRFLAADREVAAEMVKALGIRVE
ncbi:MAG: tripartite tricarboxylate transporter substrate binding protein [Betaproteobacteria bacterium]|nr:tripartite tricarboxylate transporter substrate binding protein [Betaproteobacteria bacterium]